MKITGAMRGMESAFLDWTERGVSEDRLEIGARYERKSDWTESINIF